jgi:hypothetical protein
MRRSSHGIAADGATPAALESLAEDVIFRPTLETQRMAKARFWAMVAENPMLDPASMGIDQIRGMLQSEAVGKWWNLPGFQAWFLNRDFLRYKLESLFEEGLDALQEVLQNRDPKAQSARVNAIKMVGELAAKFPSRQAASAGASSALEKAIGAMDRVQLEAYLQKNGASLKLTASGENNPPTINVTPEDIKE